MAATLTLVCPIHSTKELTKLGSCVSCRKRVQGIPKPDTAPNLARSPNPTKSLASLRAERYRARQKELNPDFNEQEKKRKQVERSQKIIKRDTKAQDAEKRAEMLKELLESGQFPKSLQLLRTKIGLGLFLKDAPEGKGQIVLGDAALAAHDSLRIDNLENTAPLRAQLTEAEIQAKLLSQDTESRIEILKALIDGDIQEQLPHQIEELLPGNINDFSIDEINQLFDAVFETVDWLRDLLYPEKDKGTKSSLDKNQAPQESRHIKRKGHLPTEKQQLEKEYSTRELFVPGVPRGPQERAMKNFMDYLMEGNSIPTCSVCHEQLAPDFSAYVGAAFKHLKDKHPDLFQKMREAIKKAGERKCRRSWVHKEVLQRLLGDGTKKVKCQCGKVLYRLPKQAKKSVRTRPYAENEKAA